MRKLILKYSAIALCTAFAISCSDDQNEHSPLIENNAIPGQISNIVVTDLSGKSEITYNLPNDKNLLYVKANYVLDNGTEMEVKSSYYKKSLLIEGFATAGPREVKLYSVSRNEIESEPITVTVTPSESPLFEIFRNLKVGPDFGGIFIEAENPERTDVAILVMEKDDNGDWVTNGNSIYTSTNEIFRTVRGLDTLEYDLAFTIRDRFLNTTDTLFQTIKPIYETEISRTQYTGYPLPGDAPTEDFGFGLDRLFDNNFRSWPRIYITDASAPAPHAFTIDLGQEVKISRVKIWDYPQQTSSGFFYYWQFNMRKFEIWGSNNPSTDGSWDSWELLDTYEVIKPSGLPLTQQNNEDLEYAQDGFNWPIPITAPKYRYLRINNLENWAGTGRLAIAEMRVYGDTR
ncbi:DUF5000 domain-containing lipoprotein [Algibacter pacificus]|uniref:DUF5000 domain-containing lipoprotein n=1 Tax=Algibacter pacificus TaxID=2599389 RepID=UPI0011C77B80|nr:DUF5000 domain-containing lipoprotein [Algibacter pacificus]